MRKWKLVCRLKTMLNNKKPQWKSDRGITLVELLASLAILSVVILLAGSVNIFGQKQFINQTESASQSNDMSYALSVMSRDLRKEEGQNVKVKEEGALIETTGGTIFSYSNNQILKNGEPLVSSIKKATFKKNNDNSILIEMESESAQSQTKNYKTTIYFRR